MIENCGEKWQRLGLQLCLELSGMGTDCFGQRLHILGAKQIPWISLTATDVLR